MISEMNSIFLGIVQGLTEFLPISSSGHLVLFQHLLGFKEPALLLDVSLHLGTLLAVCVYFRNDLLSMIEETVSFSRDLFRGRKKLRQVHESAHVSLLLWVVVGSVPTALIGLLFKDPLERLFSSVTLVGVMLMVTGLFLGVSVLTSRGNRKRGKLSMLAALAVGTAQGIAIIPGISRSGTTIVCGLFMGLERELAARFSFLLSIPAILGALLLQLRSGAPAGADLLPIVAGFIASALVGLLALKLLMGMVRKGRLAYFAPYCWALGIIILLT